MMKNGGRKSRGKGKSKGSSFEREMAKSFSLWWSKGKCKDVFWRSAGSGAKSTVTGSTKMAGDLLQINMDYPEFPFSVEFKFWKSWCLSELIEYPNGGYRRIGNFINQCKKDAIRSEKYFCLVLKKNFHEPIIVIEKEVFNNIEKIEKDKIDWIFWRSMCIAMLGDFFENINPSIFYGSSLGVK